MKKCVCIFGATASGKTGLSIELAKKYNGVIISFDSMQIYKRLDIGTAKPTKEELTEADFRLTDFLPLEEKFSVYDFKKLAENEIENVLSEKKLPILCGGTGLYFDSVLNNTDFGEFEANEEISLDLNKRSENMELLLEELRSVDPETAQKLHIKDKKRIIRALEVYYTTGKTISEFRKNSHKKPSEYTFLNLRLTYLNRETLYDRINSRVDKMLAEGLIDETKLLLKDNFLETSTASQAIGYKEIISYLQGKSTLEDSVALLKQHTRNYAKRQITWFKRYDAKDIIMDSDKSPIEESIKYINEFLRN